VNNKLHFFQYKNENDQNGTFKNFVYMENFINLPPTPEGEIFCLKGGNGWGVPLGNEGSGAFKYLCNMLYTHRWLILGVLAINYLACIGKDNKEEN